MILVDSGVWIDYLNGTMTAATIQLDGLLGTEVVAVGDLMLTEVLQGFDHDHQFEKAHRMFSLFDVVEIGGEAVAIQAARNYRELRRQGITIRKTIDCLIATRCILDGHRLLHNDRDFDPFERYLGLRVVKATQ